MANKLIERILRPISAWFHLANFIMAFRQGSWVA